MAEMMQLGPLSINPPRQYSPPRVKRQDKAAWMVAGKGFFDQNAKFWRPGECLYYSGVPNADLIPLNKLAYDNLQLWLDLMDELDEKACKANKKQFVPRPRQEWKEEGEIVDVPMPDSIFAPAAKEVNEAIR